MAKKNNVFLKVLAGLGIATGAAALTQKAKGFMERQADAYEEKQNAEEEPTPDRNEEALASLTEQERELVEFIGEVLPWDELEDDFEMADLITILKNEITEGRTLLSELKRLMTGLTYTEDNLVTAATQLMLSLATNEDKLNFILEFAGEKFLAGEESKDDYDEDYDEEYDY